MQTEALNPPHGIRGEIVSSTPYYLGAVLLLIIILILIWVWIRFKRSRNKKTSEIKKPNQILKEKIMNIIFPSTFTKENQKTFFITLNLIFRETMELCFKIPATDLTSKQLEPLIKKNIPTSEKTIFEIILFLNESDLIKFSTKEISEEDGKKMFHQCREWILGWLNQYERRNLE